MHLRALADLPLRRLDPPLGPALQRLPSEMTRLLDHPLFRGVRFLQFAVAAFDEREKVAEGTHERYVIERSKFLANLEDKNN